MTEIIREDEITVLPLSVRSVNALRRAQICTVGDLLTLTEEQLPGIRNMGAKSIAETTAILRMLREDDGEFLLVEHRTEPEPEPGELVLVKDVDISELNLSIRSANCLNRAGICKVSQILAMTDEALLAIPSMGKKSLGEIREKMESLKGTVLVHTAAGAAGQGCSPYDMEIAEEMAARYGKDPAVWRREILSVRKEYPESQGESLIYRLYEGEYIGRTARSSVLRLVEESGDELSRAVLEEKMPRHLRNTSILTDLLLEMEREDLIELGEMMIHRKYPSVVQFAAQLTNARRRQVLQMRLAGATLTEIGEELGGLSRERIRQLEKQTLEGKPRLQEDRYLYIYDHYDISLEDFLFAFDEPASTYHYLEMCSQITRSKRKPFEEVLTDTNVPPALRKRAERGIYREFVLADGVHIRRTRPEMVKHFIRQNCRELTKYEDFVRKYQLWLEELGQGENAALVVENRTYENILNQADYVLWNQWKGLRYYNLAEYDFEELLTTLDLSQYENVELSTLKFLRDYPALMVQYDIQDEYELHNLLKKILPREGLDITFKRMPMIEFGTANRDDQILELLLQYAPITAEEFGAIYEQTYGARAATILANYMGSLDEYYYNGVYTVTSANLPQEKFQRMKAVLTGPLYAISDVKRIYLREFPGADTGDINPYTLKTLGFRVYSGYVVSNRYSTASEYFCEILTTDDIVDARTFSKTVTNIVAYNSELYRLRAGYEILEYAPLQYINLRRLEAAGITRESLGAYCRAVADFTERGDYFTTESLKQDGFSHALEDLGFEAWFYSSVLLEDRENFSYQRVGGTRIFLRGKPRANIGGMLTWILEQEEKMDFYDLMELLDNRYGVKLPRDKLLEIISGTDLYYDGIMEAVYIDYDTYFEEI